MDNISNSVIEAVVILFNCSISIIGCLQTIRLIRGIILANQLLCLVDVIFCTIIVAVIYWFLCFVKMIVRIRTIETDCCIRYWYKLISTILNRPKAQYESTKCFRLKIHWIFMICPNIKDFHANQYRFTGFHNNDICDK
jgi:hypothetical protein